ncbi:MAG: phosphotransferase [Deltaproteobacteria bacterium]|jgi:aminoglycoside/choline kinase family phosphotransferase|nr:phosphotransferase [Deltaproteobacteria bacterium]
MEDTLPMALKWADAQWEGSRGSVPEPMRPDASERCYYRLRREGVPCTRLLLVGPDHSENLRWLLLGRELWHAGFSLPRILSADAGRGFFLLEDLGDLRLDRALRPESFQKADKGPISAKAPADTQPDTQPRANGADIPPAALLAYERLMVLTARLHNEGLGVLSRLAGHFCEEYTAGFAMGHEWGYFLKGLGLLSISYVDVPGLREEAMALAESIVSGEGGVFIHRDLQSRNVMLRDGEPFLLDWQGGRVGPSSYDLASLLWDPYASLPEGLREGLLDCYLSARKPLGVDPESFRRRVRRAAVMRLMQAFGAYARLSVEKGLAGYADYLEPALEGIAGLLGAFAAGGLESGPKVGDAPLGKAGPDASGAAYPRLLALAESSLAALRSLDTVASESQGL